MAVKIRLRRVGAKKQPAYRIVIADARAPRDGRFIEIIGHYNPLTDPATVVIDGERALYWLRHGAQPTEIIQRMFVKQGIWAQYTGEALPQVAAEEPAPAPVAETPLVEAPAPVASALSAPEVEETPAADEVAPAAETVDEE